MAAVTAAAIKAEAKQRSLYSTAPPHGIIHWARAHGMDLDIEVKEYAIDFLVLNKVPAPGTSMVKTAAAIEERFILDCPLAPGVSYKDARLPPVPGLDPVDDGDGDDDDDDDDDDGDDASMDTSSSEDEDDEKTPTTPAVAPPVVPQPTPTPTLITPQKQKRAKRKRSPDRTPTSASSSSLLPLTTTLRCLTCLAPSPRPTWEALCKCGRRGDLAYDHPLNQSLMSAASASASPSVNQITAAISASLPLASLTSGQSAREEEQAMLSNLMPIDKEIVRLFRFDKSRGYATFDVVGEIDTAGVYRMLLTSLGASSIVSPGEPIVNLVRSGRLAQVSLALPRTLDELVNSRVSDATIAGATTKAAVAPALKNINEFFMALICTILPVFINHPTALATWITLARTILVLNQTRGWPFASMYLDRILAVRIADRQSFAPIDHDVLYDIKEQIGGKRGNAQAPNQPAAQAQTNKPAKKAAAAGARTKSADICRNYNANTCSYSAAACDRTHACSTCGTGHHRANSSSCKSSSSSTSEPATKKHKVVKKEDTK